jgi:hypothetical protein
LSIKIIYIKTLLGIIIFYIIKTNILFLFCLTDIDKLGIYLNNIVNRLV